MILNMAFRVYYRYIVVYFLKDMEGVGMQVKSSIVIWMRKTRREGKDERCGPNDGYDGSQLCKRSIEAATTSVRDLTDKNDDA